MMASKQIRRGATLLQTFAKHANLTDLQSFISSTAAPLHLLMSPKKTFMWTADHEQAFQQVKEALSNSSAPTNFDSAQPTVLHTDASCL